LGPNDPHVWATVGAEARVRANPAVVANDETVVARVFVERVGHPVVAGLVRPADDDVGAVAERFVARVAAPAQAHLFADAYGFPTRVRERLETADDERAVGLECDRRHRVVGHRLSFDFGYTVSGLSRACAGQGPGGRRSRTRFPD